MEKIGRCRIRNSGLSCMLLSCSPTDFILIIYCYLRIALYVSHLLGFRSEVTQAMQDAEVVEVALFHG
jgi:hypothetical protein